MSIPQFGLIAATHTPFDEKGDLDLRILPALAEHLANHRVAGAFVAGSTGESHSLSVSERKLLTERWVEAAADRPLEVIVHVGSNAQREAIELARHAAGTGAGAVAALAPCYFKPATLCDLIDFLAPIADAAGDLPFYYYHIPCMTGVDLPMVELLRRGAERMPNLRGIKYSDMNLSQMQECIQLDGGRFDILFGCDESLLAGLALGIRGAVGSTYNFAAGLYHTVIESFETGDLLAAQAAQARAVAMVDVLRRRSFLPASRVAMEMLDLPLGPARPPLGRVVGEERQRLIDELEALDVLDAATAATVFARGDLVG